MKIVSFPVKWSPGIVFFDGNCSFCNQWVRLLIRWDAKGLYKFCSLSENSELIKLLKIQGLENQVDSIILVQNGNFYYKSNAILKLLTGLGLIGSLFKVFYLIPRTLRDGLYDLVAKNRYGFKLNKSACPLPDFKNSQRIIQNKEALDFLLRRFS